MGTPPRSALENLLGGRTARRIRACLEKWHSRYPASEQAELRARLQSTNEEALHSAFFELVLHELFFRNGWSAEAHPTIPGTFRKPDFKFTKGDEALILEAKVAMGRSASETAAIKRLNAMIDTINRRVSADRFFISVSTQGLPEHDIRARQLADNLQRWLNGIDYEDALRKVAQGSPEKYDFSAGNFHAFFEAFPRNRERAQETGRVIGGYAHGHEGGWVQDRASLRDAVEEKARAYGQLNVPYVIAVNVWEYLGDTAFSSLEALYGAKQPQYTAYLSGQTKLEEVSAGNGCFGTPDNQRKTNVSGILIVNNALPWAIANKEIVYVPHVWSDFPAGSPIRGTTDVIYDSQRKGFRCESGRAFTDLLDLPKNWPYDGSDDF